MGRLDQLLLEWEERRDRGEPVTPETLCPDDPALRTRLAARIRLLERFDAWAAAPQPLPEAPARVGKYDIRGVLGRGGVGVVYDGWDPVLKRRAAVKVLHPGPGGERAAARFAREGQALARLDHPGVVGVYDAGVDGGRPYLAMKYVPGGTLADHRERLTAAGPRAIVPLMVAVARAVEYAHAHPDGAVLHRDLKPGNVLLDAAGEPLVADFGLARLLADDGPGEEATGDAVTVVQAGLTTAGGPQPGTPAYMAPEQYDDRLGPVGPAADVWALGVMLYELLAGRRPFPGADRHALAEQVTRDPAPPLTGVGRRVAAVVAKCLEKKPARRFRSAGDLADALASTRRPSRRAVLLGVVAAVAAAGGLGMLQGFDWDRWRYDRHLADVRRRLDAGEEVTLVGPGRGRSPVYRVAAGRETTQVGWDDTAVWVTSHNDCSLVELAALRPDVGYVIRAVIGLDTALNRRAAWGVYVNHQQWPGDRPRHTFDHAGFEDSAADPGRTLATLYQRWYGPPADPPDGRPAEQWCFETRDGQSAWADVLRAGGGDVRRFEVAVRPDEVAATLAFDSPTSPLRLVPLHPPDRANFRRAAGRLWGYRLGPPPDPLVRVGLFARHAHCVVHELTIARTPEESP